MDNYITYNKLKNHTKHNNQIELDMCIAIKFIVAYILNDMPYF